MTASWIIDQLIQQGVEQFFIAPGSRSTPLAAAIAEHPKAKIHVHYDERGLGFFALGASKAGKKPTALITTSGTAVGNLLPAIMEAHHSYTPLIVLTADRPAELRDCGANQTTDQVKMFQPFVRWQVDLPVSCTEEYFRSIAAQSYFHSIANPPGPVHINCPFRDPLYVPNLAISEGKPLHISLPTLHPKPFKTLHAKGLILIGKLPKNQDLFAILNLAKQLQWPVLADLLSNARCHMTKEQIRYFDWIEKPTPSLILHFGERMTSKRILDWQKTIPSEQIHISPYPTLQDPARILTTRIQSDITCFCEHFEAPTDPNWLESWQDLEPQFEETDTFTEVHAIRTLSQIIPPDFALFFGNGMPIRDADHFFFPKASKSIFGNRGQSGIDGNIATIAGLAEHFPVLGMIGDQAALYDLNSLPLLKKTKHPALLLISNNFGGGIFHHLPVATSPHFETLWAAAHTMRFEPACQMFDLPYAPFDALEEFLGKRTSGVIELITSRKSNYEYQKKVLFSDSIKSSH